MQRGEKNAAAGAQTFLPYLLYAVLREDRSGAPNRSQVEPAVLLASLRYLLAPACARVKYVFRRKGGRTDIACHSIGTRIMCVHASERTGYAPWESLEHACLQRSEHVAVMAAAPRSNSLKDKLHSNAAL